MSQLSTSEFNIAVGNRIGLVRDRHTLTQFQFASTVDASARAVTNWERGLREVPSAVVATMCRKLDVNANWLLADFGPPAASRLTLNTDYLAVVIVKVDSLDARLNLRLPPAEKARIIAELYQLATEGKTLDEDATQSVISGLRRA